LLVLPALAFLVSPVWAANKNLVTVTVTGMGESEEEAIKDGKRKAVEQAAGAKIYSASKTKDFVLVKDTILTRAAGFVQEFKVLSKNVTEDDIHEVKMSVTVSKKGIEDTWGVVTNLLKDMGRPKIMVFIRERVDKEWQEAPTVQTRLENRLLKSGFILVDKQQLKAIDKRDLAAAIAEDKPEKVQAIAKRFGAQIFVTGVAKATTAGKRVIYGRARYIYEADANVKVYRSDTAQIMAAIPGKATRGVKDVARSAAKQALDAQGKLIARNVTMDILQFWMDVMEGRGEVQMKVGSLTFAQYSKLKKALKEVKGVKAVNGKYHNKTAELSLESDTNAEALAERIGEALEGTLEITDVSQNVIKADYKKE
jgi:hypothetical protein